MVQINTNFCSLQTLGFDTWEALKYKIAIKITEDYPDNYRPKFICIFGGSSVTIGKDNYYNQSYPLVFERRMKPIFSALGIELVVRNIAMAGHGCDPYNSCYEPHSDPDPDFVNW